MIPVYILWWVCLAAADGSGVSGYHQSRSDQTAAKSMDSHTFVIEIDRQGPKGTSLPVDPSEQERIRWRWPQRDIGNRSTSGKRRTVVEELMLFLDEKVGVGADGVGVPTAAMGDDERACYYTVEMHDRERGGWIPLESSAFPGCNIPKNCRLRVSVPARAPNVTTGKTADSDQRRPEAAEAPLALPWKRFDRDLGSGGLEVRGRKVVVQDVPNSDEGTGLSTWDGSVLLAKYVEHRAAEIIGKIDDHQEERHHPDEEREQPRSRDPRERKESSLAVTRNTGSPRGVFRVLELGCGTGLSGLASAVALGEQLREDSMESSLYVSPANERGNRIAGMARVGVMVEVILTDLPYALGNARANIAHNAESLASKGVATVVAARELDWLRPVPPELMSEDFDLILAADVVWLDELVEPLVRTLERLTANWAGDGREWSSECQSSTSPGVNVGDESAIDLSAREDIHGPGHCCPAAPESEGVIGQRESGGDSLEGVTQELEEGGGNVEVRSDRAFPASTGVSDGGAGGSESGARQFQLRRPRRRRRQRRILLAYQWRSERTGRALLRELDSVFHVREIPPEDFHPDYMPDSSLCLFEAVRRHRDVSCGDVFSVQGNGGTLGC